MYVLYFGAILIYNSNICKAAFLPPGATASGCRWSHENTLWMRTPAKSKSYPTGDPHS